jgi:trehalose 6-phosphate phosphatase
MPPLRADWAFFLDIDGTLLDIEQRPEAVHVGPRELELVSALHRATHGALALVSGRPLAGIDLLFHPLKLPLAGQHGAERRDARGVRHRHRFPVRLLQRAAQPVREFAAAHQGILFEDKGASVALHYRLAPQLVDAAEAVVREAAQSAAGGLQMQHGKMVFELKPAGCDKGTAIEQFMQDEPFAGRTPVFLGDDVTDEDGFRAVNRLNGHSLKVGEGPSVARWRLAGPREARAWLGDWLQAYGWK